MDKLFELVGRGSTHIETIAEIARAVETDSREHTKLAVRGLASCGARGKHSSNTERDLSTWARGAYGFELEPYTVELTLQASQQSFIYYFSFVIFHLGS